MKPQPHQPHQPATSWAGKLFLALAVSITTVLTTLLTTVRQHREVEPERGDVPGWVLITLMTAGIVVVLMAVAGPTLQRIFLDAMSSVTG